MDTLLISAFQSSSLGRCRRGGGSAQWSAQSATPTRLIPTTTTSTQQWNRTHNIIITVTMPPRTERRMGEAISRHSDKLDAQQFGKMSDVYDKEKWLPLSSTLVPKPLEMIQITCGVRFLVQRKFDDLTSLRLLGSIVLLVYDAVECAGVPVEYAFFW